MATKINQRQGSTGLNAQSLSQLIFDYGSLQLIHLGLDRVEESLALEQSAYETPWSDKLIRGEFDKDVSFRPALIIDNQLIAQSFNYLVVDELHILNISVSPKYRRLGYGRFLLQEIIKLATARGVTFATLEVRRSNLSAQALYQQQNFTITGLRPNYYKNNNEDALILDRNLSLTS